MFSTSDLQINYVAPDSAEAPDAAALDGASPAQAPEPEVVVEAVADKQRKGPTNIIRKTQAYADFSFLDSNRKLNEKHVQALVKSLEEHDLLEDNPIIVTQDLVVLDGQHRLEAAMRLGLPIYYKISTKMGEGDIAIFNSTSSDWKLQNYLEFYVNKGLPAYVTLQNFCQEHGLLPYNGIGLMNGNSAQPGGKEVKSFERGEFSITDREHAEKIINYINDFSEIMPYSKSKAFMNALVRISRLPFYNHEEMLRKSKQQRDRFGIKYNDVRSWLNLLEEVYNFHRPAKDAVNFRVA